jgi:hypothetical protein
LSSGDGEFEPLSSSSEEDLALEDPAEEEMEEQVQEAQGTGYQYLIMIGVPGLQLMAE